MALRSRYMKSVSETVVSQSSAQRFVQQRPWEARTNQQDLTKQSRRGSRRPTQHELARGLAARDRFITQGATPPGVAPKGVTQAPWSTVVDDCFDRPRVRQPTSAMATIGVGPPRPSVRSLRGDRTPAGSGATFSASGRKACRCRDHRRWSFVDGLDVLGAVDPT
jgi:hypothetical protein